MANLYPVLLNLLGVRCLVVGGGDVALRKTEALLFCGAEVTVISPNYDPSWSKILPSEQLSRVERTFRQGDCREFQLVISATDDEQVNAMVAEECKVAGKLVNVVDDPQKCSFLVPSVLRRGDLLIAVSTGGRSPFTAKLIRGELEKRYGPEYEDYLSLLGEARREVLTNVADPKRRREIFTLLTDGCLLGLIQQGRMNEAKEWVKRCLS